MPEPNPPKEPAALWKAQPEEKTAVTLENIVQRRTVELYASTRSEILMSIGAAMLLVGVVALRFGASRDPLEEAGCALVVLWVAVTLYRLRDRIRPAPSPPDAAAATGAEYYRKELERRREHLRDAWLWHGPLFLACVILAGIWTDWRWTTLRLERVAPLLVLLALWVGYGVWRRLRQARELQREIDELRG